MKLLLSLLGACVATPLPDSLRLTVNERTYSLYRFSVRSDDFEVMSWTEKGGYVVEPLPEVRTYWGLVDDEPNTIVMTCIDMRGYFYANAWNHETGHSWAWTQGGVDVNDQLGSLETPPPPPEPTSGTPHHGGEAVDRPLGGFKIYSGEAHDVQYEKLVWAEIAFDIMNKSYNSYDSLESAVIRQEMYVMGYDFMMTRDVRIRIKFTHAVVRKEQFYPKSNDPGLGNMKAEWTKQPLWSKPWDMVWASQGWYAWGGQIGKGKSCYSAGAMYHENGHNWGAFHLAYHSDTMGGNQPHHGPYSVDVVDKFRTKAINEGHLTQAESPPYPVHPHTSVDVVALELGSGEVALDVMANDYDANGDDISLVNVTSVTGVGGAARIEGKFIMYTPPEGYVGKDMIVYTIEDSSPLHLKTSDWVHVEIMNNDLMVHYDFEDGNGEGETVFDVSGVGREGDLNRAIWERDRVPSPMGYGIHIDGTQTSGNLEGYNFGGILIGKGSIAPIEITGGKNRSPFDVAANRHSGYYDIVNHDWSLSFWYMCEGVSDTEFPTSPTRPYIFSKFWHPDKATGTAAYIGDGGSIVLQYFPYDGTYQNKKSSTFQAKLKPYQWHHHTVVYDMKNNNLKYYVDGALVGGIDTLILDGKNYMFFQGRVPLMIGLYTYEKAYTDEIKVYSRVLSQMEAQQEYYKAGHTSRFMVESLEKSMRTFEYFSETLSSKVWNVASNDVSFSSADLPSWMTLTPTGHMYGVPTEVGSHEFTIEGRNGVAEMFSMTYKVEVVGHTGYSVARYWLSVGGATLNDLKKLDTYPDSPDSHTLIPGFQVSTGTDNFGIVVAAFLKVPYTGTYVFHFLSDDYGELYISGDELERTKLAWVNGWCNWDQWTKYGSQTGDAIELTQGTYVLESTVKQGGGSAYLRVAWSFNGGEQQIIEGDILEPLFIPTTTVPDVSGTALDALSDLLSDHDLKMGKSVPVPSNEAVGTVVGMSLPIGTEVLPQSELDFFVSSGPPSSVRDYTNQSINDATDMLEADGFTHTLIKVTSFDSETMLIAGQSQWPGTDIVTGHVIELAESIGSYLCSAPSGSYWWRPVELGVWNESPMLATTFQLVNWFGEDPTGNKQVTWTQGVPAIVTVGTTKADRPPFVNPEFAALGITATSTDGTVIHLYERMVPIGQDVIVSGGGTGDDNLYVFVRHIATLVKVPKLIHTFGTSTKALVTLSGLHYTYPQGESDDFVTGQRPEEGQIVPMYTEVEILYEEEEVTPAGVYTVHEDANPDAWESGTLAIGGKVYTDRNYIFAYTPPLVIGMNYLIPPNALKWFDGPYLVAFEAEVDMTVIIATPGSTPPYWTRGWTRLNEYVILNQGGTRVVVGTVIPAGTHVELGSHPSNNGVYHTFFQETSSAPVIIPHLIGRKADVAESTATELGLSVKRVNISMEGGTSGTVFGQSLIYGDLASRNSEIVLEILS